MKNKWIIYLLILSLAINTAVLIVAGYKVYINDHKPAPVRTFSNLMNHHFYQTLGLTPAQLKKMTPMATLFHRKLEAVYSSIQIKKDLLVQLLSQKNIDPDQIDQVREQISAVQDKIQKIVISHLLDVKLILDENQQKLFFALLSKSMNTEQCFFLNNQDK